MTQAFHTEINISGSGQGEYVDLSQRLGQYTYDKGERIGGRYEVLQRLPGGFGHVYLCYDWQQDYFYALKTLRLPQEVLKNPDTIDRLHGEIQNWINLGEHDHIVRCFRFEMIDNLPFIISEWVADDDRLTRQYQDQRADEPWFFDWYARMGRQGLALRRRAATRNQESGGTSLHEWIRAQQRLAPALALRLALDICAGMQHIQRVNPGLLHLDLKPANILLTEQLRAKVTDFGTTTRLKDMLDMHLPGGTLEYMAPEQWPENQLEAGADIDVRTDIYAVGCILYEMVTGKQAFSAPGRNRQQLYQQHRHGPLPELPKGIPVEIQEIVDACLRKEPRYRPSSFDQLGALLTEAYESVTGDPPELVAEHWVESVESVNQSAFTFLNLGKYEKALELFARAIELDGAYPNTYTNRGCLYHIQGQYEEALADYQQAIRLGRRAINSRVFNNRGLVHLALGRLGKAQQDIERAIGLDEAYANAHVNLGVVCIAQECYDDALVAFERGLALNPNHAIAHNNCGFVYQHGGQLDAAIEQYTAALDQDPFFLRAWINRYLAFRELGDESAAAQDWEQIVALGKDAIDPEGLEATPLANPPDAQFDNRGGVQEILGQPLRQQRLRDQYEKEQMGLAARPPERIPFESRVVVAGVAYADWLHDSILRRQESGDRLTQLTLQVDVVQADGQHRPFADVQEWNVVLDDETVGQMAGRGLTTIEDLEGNWLTLRNEYPHDIRHPLRIWIVH